MRFLFLMAVLLPIAARAVEDSPLVIIDASKQKQQTAAPEVAPATSETTTPPAATVATPAQPPAAAAAEALVSDFPTWAISKAGSDTTGQTGEAPTPPTSPAAAAPPSSPASPASPEAPKAPPAVGSPADKLWPRDTVPIFMRSCTGLHVEYLAPCSCVITKLMLAIPHNEFIELSAADKINDDKRVLDIRNGCLATPGKRKE